MAISGTLLNVLTVLIGGGLGLLVGGRLPARLQNIIIGGLGLSTLVIGMQNALITRNPLILLGSILVGGIFGEFLRLDQKLEQLGDTLQKRMAGSGKGASTFSEAFVTSSLVFCVGPLTILGSILNGVNGDIKLLAVKSLLDGFAAFAFAATLGWGVLVSAVTVLVYQGTLSLIAAALANGVPSRDSSYIVEMTAAGGLIILGVGLKLLNIKELKLANYLPALAIAPAIVWIIENWPFK
ncbi:MAG: DUF554 domain-containing protein [Chloroflexota bacterium]|nr:DUF554 domain-containing protein [Chloroflexota bacterium]